jgi:hypothetical protein
MAARTAQFAFFVDQLMAAAEAITPMLAGNVFVNLWCANFQILLVFFDGFHNSIFLAAIFVFNFFPHHGQNEIVTNELPPSWIIMPCSPVLSAK